MKTNPLIPKIALLSLGLSITAWSQTPVPIQNASFESQVVGEGLAVSGVDDWTIVGGGGAGVFHPTTSEYPGGVPDGSNVAFLTAVTDGDGLSQVLSGATGVLLKDATYVLTVQVGNPQGFAYDGYRVQLRAGGELLAEDNNTESPAAGSFEPSTVNYTYNATAHEAQLGEPLEIRLLSKALASGETNFDDVQLTFSLTNPVADAGGPYTVFPNGSLQLDGSGSLPSDGETLTAYDWDLKNNNDFDDVTGDSPTPAAISFADLQSLYGMSLGENTIQLVVTDSASKTSAIATTTVNLVNLDAQLGILDLTANGGINPATGEPWKAGDRFRQVFISSVAVNPQAGPEMNDIATWNAAVQNIANNATGHDLSSVTWKIIGSSADVDARDNTSTNPNVYGTGHAILNMQGLVIHNNFTELWAGIEPVNRPMWTENEGEHMDDVPSPGAVPWSLTGTFWNGTADGTLYLRQTVAGSGPQIRQGRNVEGSAAGWIYAWRTGANWRTRDAFSVYGMSDPLFVIDRSDAVAPNFVSFANDVDGSTITFPDDSVVYTVTFDEAILPSTLTADEFENALATSVSIGNIRQLEDPAVFEVSVTPLSSGFIQLQIKKDAVITDLNGNPLDTGTAITDATIIEVIGGTAFQVWADGYAGLTNSDPTLDFDGGGLATGIEWVLGGDPTNPADDATIAPTFDNSDPDDFVFTFNRRDDAENDPDTTIVVEYGSDLISWDPATHGVDGVTIDDTAVPQAGFRTVVVTIPKTLAAGNKLFARLSVEVATP